MPPSCADSLHAGFLCGKARGVAFVSIRLALHVSDLARGEDPVDELPSKALDGRSNARHLGKVHARPDDHFSSVPEVVIVRRPCFTPLVLMSVSATCRTSADLPRTTTTSRQWS